MATPTRERAFAIVGAGQAGAWVARTLRAEGFEGRIVLIGREPHWPYERPPLSKAVLTGAAQCVDATLLTAAQADELAIEAWLDDSAVSIDLEARRLTCRSGRALAYETLFLTTGAMPRRPPWLPTQASPAIHLLRTADDAMRLQAALARIGRLLVVGGGWIGLEVAATARSLGLEVTLLEMGERLCARSTPPVVSDYLRDLHEGHGVRVLLGAQGRELAACPDAVALTLADGRRLEADALVVGIGIAPDTQLAEACGLDVADGVLVDAAGRTSDPHVFAAGDVARQRNGAAVGARLESWFNAQAQAIVAAKAALGAPDLYSDVPWAWSDQYDVGLQMVGAPERASDVALRLEAAGGGRCWLALDAAGRPLGAVAANAPRELRVIRKALQTGAAVPARAWMDPAKPLASLAIPRGAS